MEGIEAREGERLGGVEEGGVERGRIRSRGGSEVGAACAFEGV